MSGRSSSSSNKFVSTGNFGDFGTVLILDVVIFAAILIGFHFLRTRRSLRYFFSPKSFDKNAAVENLPNNTSFFGWITAPRSISYERLYELRGLDATMHVYFLRTMILLFVTILPFAMAILAVNATGDQGVGGIPKLSVANIARGSQRMWVSVGCGYIITALALYWLYNGYRFFAQFSAYENQKNLANNYSVLLRSQTPIHENPAPGTNVFINNAFKANKLRRLEDKRTKLLQKRQFLALEQQEKGRAPLRFNFLKCHKVDELAHVDAKIHKLDLKIAAIPRPLKQAPASFVTFPSISEANNFVNNVHHPVTLRVTKAPYVNDVRWASFGVSTLQRNLFTALVIVATFFLLFFWAIPVAFVQGLANLDALGRQKGLHFLRGTTGWSTIPRGLVQGFLPPLVLIVFFSLVPLILRKLNTLRAPQTYSRLDRLVLVSYYAFDVVNVFLVSAFAGGIFNIIAQLRQHFNSSTVANLLGSAIPAQSDFFINLLLAYTFITWPLRLIRLPELFKRYSTIRKGKTQTERTFYEQPVPRLYSLTYAIELLAFTIAISYSFIAPFIVPWAILFFVVSHFISKFEAVYVSVPQNYGRGTHWNSVFGCAIAGLLIGHFIFYSTLSLKGFPESAALAPASIATILFAIWIRKTFVKNNGQNVPQDSTSNNALLIQDGYRFQTSYVDPIIDARRKNLTETENRILSNELEVGLTPNDSVRAPEVGTAAV
eukprot:TRINITY_DN6089_c0_g1_i1.p1 TRINITY_DN6089_c0_g1~~TRINITY_DN6089_c0_g1_i1.p1  ORF type:complete len:717 (+),score=110.11 TRINITY_DN6089_c0_g1_i1:307-2457(+)